MAGPNDELKRLQRLALLQAEERSRGAALNYYNECKEEVFTAIRNHPVSRALIEHTPGAFIDRGGTLFGFLGFEADSNPVEELIDFLDGLWRPVVNKELGIFGYRLTFKMDIPKPRDLVAGGITLPWQPSAPWPYFIENSISNLPYFLNVAKGRSKEGIQIKSTTVDTDFEGVEYLSEIFQEVRPILRKKKFKIV